MNENTVLKELFKEVIIALIPIVLNLLLDYGVCGGVASQLPLSISGKIFSIFLIYIFYTIITVIVKKTHIATYFVCILIFILSVINNVKLYYVKSPIYLSDISFVNNIGKNNWIRLLSKI